MTLAVHEALERLGELGSDQDPIWFRTVETSPQSLPGLLSDELSPAMDVRLSYYNRNGVKVNGTLMGMVRDREHLRARREAAERTPLPEEEFRSMNLREWRDFIDRLIEEHGEDTIMTADEGVYFRIGGKK